MNFAEILSQINNQLQEIEEQEKANQKEQAELTSYIEQLKLEIEEKIYRQSELDREALELCRRGEEIREKLAKIAKIQSLSANFQDLQAEFQGNQDLLNTLYSSFSAIANPELHSNTQDRDESDEELVITIETIKAKLPQAERLYQKLVAENLEQYHTYQNMIISGLDLIWCAVGFIAFGKESYKKMSLKHHPDRQGSEQAMQLINTAWEITQDYLNSQEQTNY
jgi:DNA repair exonuclease SbcCD ATPase subunit